MRNSFLKLSVFILLISCNKNEIIAQIDDRKIYKKDLEDIMKIEIAYGSDVKEEEAFLILMQKIIDVILAEKIGIVITERDISKEESRILNQTKAPEILSKVYELLDDKERYRELYVKPLIARRAIENKFYFDSLSFQKERYNLAKEKLKFLKENKTIKDTDYFHFVPGDTSVIYKYLESEFLKNIKLNDKKAYKIFEDKFTYYPVEIIKNNEGFEIRGFHVNKKDFYDDFYFEEVAKIKVLLYNKTLKTEILKRVYKTFWEDIIR